MAVLRGNQGFGRIGRRAVGILRQSRCGQQTIPRRWLEESGVRGVTLGVSNPSCRVPRLSDGRRTRMNTMFASVITGATVRSLQPLARADMSARRGRVIGTEGSYCITKRTLVACALA